MIQLDEVGAAAQVDQAGNWTVRFGIYLPGITFPKGYRLKLRVIHEADQFVREPRDFWVDWRTGSELDLWETTITLAPQADGHFGHPGRYLYHYQLLRGERPVTIHPCSTYHTAH